MRSPKAHKGITRTNDASQHERETMKTTAQLRNEARDAESLCNWAMAARLYDEAADVHPSRGELAGRDMEQLRRRAKSCRTMFIRSENYQADLAQVQA
jgi:hypothetical protein